MTDIRRLLALVVAATLLAAACSGVDSADDADPEVTAPEAPVTEPAADPLEGSSGNIADQTIETIAPLPQGAFPLTGLAESSPGVAIDRPALAVKIDNAPAALPQAGLNDADLVFVERVEGGLTRLLAVFHSRDTELVGPVRSARSTDVPILRTLGEPLFSWSGANAEFATLIRNSNVVDVGFEAAFEAYTEDPDRSPPSHLFSSSEALYDAADGAGAAPLGVEYRRLAPDEELPLIAESATVVEIDYGDTEVIWAWDEEQSVWLRSQDGEPQLLTDGSQVSANSIIVQFVNYRDTGLVDSSGAPVPEAELIGQGDAWYFVRGSRILGSWDRRLDTQSPQYLFQNGTFALLEPGSNLDRARRAGERVDRLTPTPVDPTSVTANCFGVGPLRPIASCAMTEQTGTGTFAVKRGLADMLAGGVIMDVVNAEQARIAEDAGAVAVMALERVPADIRRDGGVARMSDPQLITEIQAAVTIPVMAKARIGHFAEAQVLQHLDVDYIDESEVLTPADEAHHIDKMAFDVPFVCGATNLGEALRPHRRGGRDDPLQGRGRHRQHRRGDASPPVDPGVISASSPRPTPPSSSTGPSSSRPRFPSCRKWPGPGSSRCRCSARAVSPPRRTPAS